MRTAEVAGGGFAGLVAATSLARRGWRVRLHEAGPDLRSFGAGIFVWENGFRVLETLGVAQEVFERSHVAHFLEERLQDGTKISARVFPSEQGGRLATMTRQTLHKALAGAAVESGVEVITNSRIIGAEPEGALLSEDRRRWPADLVIGADGIRSAVRDSLFLLRSHEVFPFAVYRFLIPFERASQLGLKHIANYWNADEGKRVLFVPCNHEDLYLLLGAHEDDPALEVPLKAGPWRKSFPGLDQILSGLPENPRFDRYEALRLRRWSEGRVAIIGDAAHAMPPTFGQGAGTAMVNALSLAAVMDREPDIDGALAAWEDRERPLTERTQNGAVHFFNTMFGKDRHANYEWQAEELAVINYFPEELV